MSLAHDVDSVKRTQDVQVSEDITFDSIFLSKQTLLGLKKSGFCYPSPVQLLGIPLGKCGFDLLLEAKSGTGKTAVFTIIALEKLDLGKGLQTVILTPTREIASQICDVVRQIGSGYKGLKVEMVIGGLSLDDDIKKFKKDVHILVGSPGRLKHLIQLKVLDVSSVRLLIIDEADRLMEKSFLTDIDEIFTEMPLEKQVIMSSATYSEESKQFISKYIKNFQHICPESDCILKGVVQKVTTVKSNSNIVRQTEYRFKELLKILTNKQFKQCLIFCNYQVRVKEVHRMLAKEQWPVELLHSKQEQLHRLDALKTLQEYKCRILVSTDLAARGIDASNIDLVINFEPPFEWQTYFHRIGRAGRFGSYGIAVTILGEGKEVTQFQNMLKGMKNSLTMHDYWTDEIFDLDNNEEETFNAKSKGIIENGMPKEDLLTVVWQKIISETNNNRDLKAHFESFDNLVSSYENNKTDTIESFADLIESFDGIKVDESQCNSPYKIMENTNLPIDDLLSVISLKNTQQPNLTNGHICEEISVNINDIAINNSDIGNSENSNTDETVQESNESILKSSYPVHLTQKLFDNKVRNILESNNAKLNKMETISPKSEFNRIYMSKGYQSINHRSNEPVRNENTTKESRRKRNNIPSQKVKISSEQHALWYYQLKNHIKNLEIAFYMNELSNQL